MTTQSPRNVMWDPRIVAPLFFAAALLVAVVWVSVADPFGGTMIDTASPSVGAEQAAVPENGTSVSAKLPKGGSLLPIKVTAAERAAVEAGDYRAFPYLTWLADLGPWYEAELDRSGKPIVHEKSTIPLDPKRVLFLARDGRVWVASKVGALRFHEPAYRTTLPTGVTAKVNEELRDKAKVNEELRTVEITDASTNRTYTVGLGAPFILAASTDQGNSDVFAVLSGGGVLEVVDFK